MKNSLRHYSLAILILWTLFSISLAVWNIEQTRSFMKDMAINEARANFTKDWAFRRWATIHGGVYVPATEFTPPNPYLTHIPERDIETPDGVQLTLMNPAYMLRQLNEFFLEEYGITGHITSLHPLRPENKPDEWEINALLQFEEGVAEVYEFSTIVEEPHLRLMRPLITEEGCLKCHGHQGYEVGNIRGGISISLPTKIYNDNLNKDIQNTALTMGGVWLLGAVGIVLAFLRLQQTLQKYEAVNEEMAKSEKYFRTILNSIDDVVYTLDTEQRHTAVYGRWLKNVSAGSAMFLGKSTAEIMGPEAAQVHQMSNLKALDGHYTIYDWSSQNGDLVQHFQTSLSPIYDETNRNIIGIIGIGRDITQQKQIQNELEDSEQRYYSLVTALVEGIVLHLIDGSITTCNPSAERILGLTKDQMMGKTSFDPNWRAIHEDGSPFPGEEHPAMMTLTTGKAQYGVIMGVHKPDGELTWISINTQPLTHDGQDKPYAVVASFNDITLLKKAQTNEINLAIEREKTNILSRFIQDASHEFRTPLSIIQTSLHLLKNYDDPKKQYTQIEKIEQQADLILQLVEDLLVMSKLDASQQLNITPVNIKALLDEVMTDRLIKTDIKEKQITIHIEPGLPDMQADYDKLLIAVIQLVRNAIKYTPKMGIISIQAERNQPRICLFINDNGPGIADHDLPHIFDRFYRGDKSHSTPGSGLGLSIVAKVIELHKGKIDVKSSPDEGTTISLCLPINQ